MSVQYIHLANLLSSGEGDWTKSMLWKVREGKITALETFWKRKELVHLLDENPSIKIFLDSGAHSLLNAQAGLINKGDKVKTEKRSEEGKLQFTEEEFVDRLSLNQRIMYSSKGGGAPQLFADFSFNKNRDVRRYLDDYIEFIHKYKKQLLGYVNLDIIYNAEESWENQKYMEENGLRPIPVFHYGEDFSWLEKYIDNYDYIGIGGVAGGITLKQFVISLGDRAFEYVREKNPEIKVHGFAVTSFDLMMRYSWYSVDSTTWLQLAAHGCVMIPKYDVDKKRFDYCARPLVVKVSDLSLVKPSTTQHYTIAFPPEVVERIEEYFDLMGFSSEKLKVDYYERRDVNVCFYEQLLKDETFRCSTKSKSDRSFF